MLTIGRFADATGYRYYDPAQIEDGVAIRRLRALELPLEIHVVEDGVREQLAAD